MPGWDTTSTASSVHRTLARTEAAVEGAVGTERSVAERWVMAYEGSGGEYRVTAAERLPIGRSLDVGREGELPLGVEVPSGTVSRRALYLTSTRRGWHVVVTNRNGALLHRWGQAPELAGGENVVEWPLLAVRLLPDDGSSVHWMLLEADDLTVTRDGTDASAAPKPRLTDLADRPGGLPPAEREAVYTVFAEQLRWPPRPNAEPLLLKQAATRLGITVSGVQERLRAARGRALRLGLGREVGLTDPSYLHVLVAGGYLPQPRDFPHRPPAP